MAARPPPSKSLDFRRLLLSVLACRDSIAPALSHNVAPGRPPSAASKREAGMATDEQDLRPDIVAHSHKGVLHPHDVGDIDQLCINTIRTLS